MCLSRTEQRKRITSFDLLATLCLRQLRRLLASFITGEYCLINSVRISRTSSAKQLSSWYAPVCSGACYFSPMAGLRISLCWTLCKSPVSSFLQLDEVSLNDRTTLWQISYSFPFCVIWKTAESVLCPFIQVINEEVKEYWSQYQPLEYTTSDHHCFPAEHCLTDHNPLILEFHLLLCLLILQISSLYCFNLSMGLLWEITQKVSLTSI